MERAGSACRGVQGECITIHFQDILSRTFPFEITAHLTLTLSTLTSSMYTENHTIKNALKCPPGKAAVSHEMNR